MDKSHGYRQHFLLAFMILFILYMYIIIVYYRLYRVENVFDLSSNNNPNFKRLTSELIENRSQQTDPQNPIIKETKNVKVYRNMCLEKTHNDTVVAVYNSNSSKAIWVQGGVGPHKKRIGEKWCVHFRKEPVPRLYKHINASAYFVKPTCSGNFYLFWMAMFDGFFGAMKFAEGSTGKGITTSKYLFTEGGEILFKEIIRLLMIWGSIKNIFINIRS